MLYVMFEAMEVKENLFFAQKSTILDGRRRRRKNVEIKPPQPPAVIGVGDGSGAELGKNCIYVASCMQHNHKQK